MREQTAPPNMDLTAIKNRIDEKSAVLYDDRTFIRRKKVSATDFRFVAADGTAVAIAANDTFTDAENVRVTAVLQDGKFRLKKPDNTFEALSAGDKFKKGAEELSVEEAPAGFTGSVLSGGTKLRVLASGGTYIVVTVGDTYTDARGKRITVAAGQKWKRPVRVLVRQWKRIPDREREPLYEFLHKYASTKNVGEPPESGWTTTCWVEEPMIDGETLPGFWKMLRTWESRYRTENPADQGVFQSLMLKGGWELDDVPAGAGDGEEDGGEAGECIESSPLHHIDREVYIEDGDIPSCEHRNDRGHVYVAAGSFNDEDGTWSGHLDDDIARDPGDFTTWSGAMMARHKMIGGTHKWNTALPNESDLASRLKELSANNLVHNGTVYPHRDIYGRPRTANGVCPETSPLEYFNAHRDFYGDMMHHTYGGDGHIRMSLDGVGVTVETSADIDQYGLFSVREHDNTTSRRVFYMRDGGNVHDTWTYKGYKSTWLPIQEIDTGYTLSLLADMDEDGMFNFTKQVTFAHEWTAWHAKMDVDSISVVYEFHNSKSPDPPSEAGHSPAELAASKGMAEIAKWLGDRPFAGLEPDYAIVSGDHDKNEYGLYDGRWNFIIPFVSVEVSTSSSANSEGVGGESVVWRNVRGDDWSRVGNGIRIKNTTYTPSTGQTITWRKTDSEFVSRTTGARLHDIQVQREIQYSDVPAGSGGKVVASYSTRQARIHTGSGWNQKT